MAIEFVSHRFDTKLKKRIEEKVKARPRIINLQGDTSIAVSYTHLRAHET